MDRRFKFYFLFFIVLELISPCILTASSLGYQLLYFDYSEPNMEETGILQGLKMNVTLSETSLVNFGVEGSFVGGGLDYDGQTLETDPDPVTTETDDLLTHLEFDGQFRSLFRSNAIKPSIGMGYRYWSNDIKDAPGVSGFEREIEYLYLPFGLNYQNPLSQNWSQTIDGTFLVLVDGTVTSHLSNANSSFPDVENTPDDGTGVRLEYSLNRQSQYNSSYSIGVFLQFWDIGRSDVVATDSDIDGDGSDDSLVEPENETLQTGISLSFLF